MSPMLVANFTLVASAGLAEEIKAVLAKVIRSVFKYFMVVLPANMSALDLTSPPSIQSQSENNKYRVFFARGELTEGGTASRLAAR